MKEKSYRVAGDKRKQLSDAAVLRLRRRYSRGDVTTTELARQFNVDPSTIARIVRGDSRRTLAGPRSCRLLTTAGEWNARHTLTTGDVKRIRARYKRGRITQARLARSYGVSAVCIHLVVRRKTWKALP